MTGFSRAECERLIRQVESKLVHGQLQPYADALQSALTEIATLTDATKILGAQRDAYAEMHRSAERSFAEAMEQIEQLRAAAP